MLFFAQIRQGCFTGAAVGSLCDYWDALNILLYSAQLAQDVFIQVSFLNPGLFTTGLQSIDPLNGT